MRSVILRGIIALVVTSFIIPPAQSYAQTTRPPNIVFILADDLGYAELGCYGQEKIRGKQRDGAKGQWGKGTVYTTATRKLSYGKRAFEPGEGRWLIPQTEHVQTREPLEPKQRNDYRRETPDYREQPDLSNQAHQNA